MNNISIKKSIFTFLLYTATFICYSQSLTINIPKDHFKIDESRSLIVSHIENIETFNNLSNYSEILIILDKTSYSFNTIPNNLNYKTSYLINFNLNQFTLYFSSLPIISIETENTIVDEPKRLANFTYSDNKQIVSSKIGIELRGGSSQSYPKKTYDLEFWEDDNGEDTHNVKFSTLRSDDDWILDAMYNEPLRLRSYIANKLWLELHTPYYLAEEPSAKAGADVMYTEIFLNGQYNGIYNLSEQVDKKQLKLKSYKDSIRGELYKGISWQASIFGYLPDFNNENRLWAGYEIKYPKEDEATDWNNIYNFADFLYNSSNLEFTNNIWTKFNYNNYLDYFIFLNLIRATDNTGKNTYIAKYTTNEPYFYVPWDLDGCFGTIWNGTNENITEGLLTNRLYDRVISLAPENYENDLYNKWESLKNSILKDNNLTKNIENQYLFLKENKIYERESLVYPNYNFGETNLLYTKTWIENRVSFLDDYFETLSVNENKIKPKLILYPNPATRIVYLKGIENLIYQEYQIYTFLGQLVDSGKLSSNFINIESFKAGNYIIIIQNKHYKLIVI